MKTFLIFLLTFPLLVNAQFEEGKQVHKKIYELEKIKLLEILNMDDEQSIKFFNRRNEFTNKTRELIEAKEEKLDELSKALDKEKEQDYKKLINELNNIEDNLFKARKDYISSLNDVLNTEQIAKVLTFERKFHKEIRDIIFKARKNKRN